MKLIKIEGQNSFEQIFYNEVFKLIRIYSQQKGITNIEHKGLTAEYIGSYYAHGLTFVMKHWLLDGAVVDAKVITDGYYILVTHSLEDLVARYSSV